MDLYADKYAVVVTYTVDLFSGIYFYNVDQFNQLLGYPKSGAAAFTIHIYHTEASTPCSLMHARTNHPPFSSWLSS